ncbi:MAG: MFS transporter [Candidatus Heimdallarchaeota archaeon]|nr:MFS transporter [Candidatus Heimdallarchaeota archaeon]MCK4878137.1 MFS transporter [Candidatus Heimdallarchaeota archaeon]
MSRFGRFFQLLKDFNGISHPYLTQKLKFLIYAISAFGTTARFVSRMFIELYAVIIGSSSTALALITSMRNLIQLALQASFGRISDFLGRKALILFGLFGGGISLALFPLIHNQWILVGGVIIFSICVACYSPAFTALLGDITNRKNRAGLLSLITLIGAIASFIGLIVVGAMSNIGKTEYMQYTIILEIAAGLFIITGFFAVLLTNPPTEKLEEKSVLSLTPLRKNKNFRTFVIVGSLMGFSMSLGWPIFPQVRGNFATAQENTWIWASFSISMIITLIVTKPIIDKVKRKWALFVGRVVMFFIPLNLAITVLWVPYWWHMAIGAAVSGFGNSFYMVAESAYALDSSTEKEKGTYMGLFYLFLGITTFAGSLISGILADQVLPILGEWETIVLFLWIITGARFISSLGFLFLKEPKEYLAS